MVSAVHHDCLTDPAKVVQDLYEKYRNGPGNTASFPSIVFDHFGRAFAQPDALHDVAPLDLSHLPESHSPHALVRFRGMVQDTSPSPEMYIASQDKKCAGWGLAGAGIEPPYDISDMKDCTVVWAVNVPGESSWVTSDASRPNGSHDAPDATRKSYLAHKNVDSTAPHLGVQLKIYDTSRGESIKATDCHTFIGFLTSEMWNVNLDDENPPVVPTLHVLYYVPSPSSVFPSTRVYPCSQFIPSLRDELLEWIAEEALGGDKDAAEWVLLSSIARVQSRRPPILPPSLNLSRFPTPPSENHSTQPVFPSVLSHILPAVSTIPLSLDTINSTPFVPESKDEDLHSGWLQLPPGNVCVITETSVKEGKINEKGIMNLRATQEMMQTQTLEYIFPFSRFNFQTDVSFIVVCEGRKSAFFQTTINVPLKPASATAASDLYKPASEIKLPSEDKLKAWRELIADSKTGNVAVGDEVAQHIENDFVDERQASSSSGPAAKKAVTGDDLVHRMMTTKLLALSCHEKEVTKEIWERMKQLEARRQERLS